MSNKTYSILISYLVGGSLGIISVLLFLFLPSILTDEGLIFMLVIGIYGKALIGMVVSFLIMLGFSGKNVLDNLSDGNSLLISSFKYSISINMIIWLVFIIITKLSDNNLDNWLLIPPIIAFIICTIISTFTVGLLVCYLIKNRLMKHYC